MVVSCLTSRYLPNLRYIARLCEVDCSVILDLAPLPHQNNDSFISRNRILNHAGDFIWLSVPVRRKGIKRIDNALVDLTNHNWIDKHIKCLAHAYPKHNIIAGNFLARLSEVLKTSDSSLLNINFRTLQLILSTLGIENISMRWQSSIVNVHKETHRLDIVNALGAKTYIAGQVEWDVMKKSGCLERMTTTGISVRRSPDLNTQTFNPQIIRNLSCLHAILTLGPNETKNLINRMTRALKSEF